MNEEELVEKFRKWMIKKGYSLKSMDCYMKKFRIVLKKLGAGATELDAWRAFSSYTRHARKEYMWLWRRYLEFRKEVEEE